jgi:Ciliary rootlet component, centrosome cohesion
MKRVTFKVLVDAILFLFVLLWCCLEFIFTHFFQLQTNKEPTSLTSRIIDGSGLDKKKPFSRPFSKSRLEHPVGASVRMASPVPAESSALLRQNHELRQRLQDESSNYRRRLDTYKQAQSNQSALVSRLQGKVLQYKQRCAELENQMNETTAICPEVMKPSLNTSTPLGTPICGKSSGPMSLPPPICPDINKSLPAYCSDESDESFERKRVDEERKL